MRARTCTVPVPFIYASVPGPAPPSGTQLKRFRMGYLMEGEPLENGTQKALKGSCLDFFLPTSTIYPLGLPILLVDALLDFSAKSQLLDGFLHYSVRNYDIFLQTKKMTEKVVLHLLEKLSEKFVLYSKKKKLNIDLFLSKMMSFPVKTSSNKLFLCQLTEQYSECEAFNTTVNCFEYFTANKSVLQCVPNQAGNLNRTGSVQCEMF